MVVGIDEARGEKIAAAFDNAAAFQTRGFANFEDPVALNCHVVTSRMSKQSDISQQEIDGAVTGVLTLHGACRNGSATFRHFTPHSIPRTRGRKVTIPGTYAMTKTAKVTMMR